MQDYLNIMGITRWLERNRINLPQTDESIVPVIEDKTVDQACGIAELNWESLQKAVASCVACGLHKTRTHTVFGVGNASADLMIVGEAPGANEDRKGLPFVGRAGQLLDAMLLAIGFKREQVFIANILKCRPPNNRDPNPEEVATCTPFLQRQVALVKPKLILAVGRIAAHFLLQSNASLSSLRGQQFSYGTEKTPLLVTFHPAYLLRSPREKRKAYQDLLSVKNFLDKSGKCDV